MKDDKYKWWRCARCGGRHLVTESMHSCYSGANGSPLGTPTAPRELTDDERFSLAAEAMGFGVLSEPDRIWAYALMDAVVRKFCEVNHICFYGNDANEDQRG